jgi:hypothetical protein
MQQRLPVGHPGVVLLYSVLVSGGNEAADVAGEGHRYNDAGAHVSGPHAAAMHRLCLQRHEHTHGAPNLTSVAVSALGQADPVIDLRQWTPWQNRAARGGCRDRAPPVNA